MNIGVILPTINLWGGVKRFLELGNRFHTMGHSMRVFTPEGKPPEWFSFNGATSKIQDIHKHPLDALFITELPFLQNLLDSSAKVKAFYHVLKTENIKPVLNHKDVHIFVNSSNLYDFDCKKYGISPVKAFGGVSITDCIPSKREQSQEFIVLTYGRLLMKRKGTRFVIKACERLYKKHRNLKLLLFDTPVDKRSQELIDSFSCKVPFEFLLNHPPQENHTLFQRADVFVIAEKNAGWSNTCAEAMAAGTPVIATRSGTKDFLFHNKTGLVVSRNSFSIGRAVDKLINNPNLAQQLAKSGNEEIKRFSWEHLAQSIESYLKNTMAQG